jgi:hypothetical protein
VGGDLQAALDTATCGDTVVLTQGAVFYATQLEQPFVAKAKPCTGLITVRGANAVPDLKTQTSAQIAALNLPKLVSKVSTPALEFQGGSKQWLIQGIEITNDSQGGVQLNNGLVFVGENSGSQIPITLANVPSDVEFDRCYVHPEVSDGTTSEYSTAIRGFSVSARNLTIHHSRIAGFRTFWKEGQTNPLSSNAVLINRGPGPYTIADNYLEAWFGTIFTGGGPQWVTNQATVAPGATTSQATLTNIVGTLPKVGDVVAFEAPGMVFTVGVLHGQPYQWGAATVTAISGNMITYVPRRSTSVQSVWGDGPGGTPLTANPNGRVVWGGDLPRDVLIERNQFVKEGVSLAQVYAATGYGPKGHIELKAAERAMIQGNTFEGYHLAFVFTPRNQPDQASGSGRDTWATVKDVQFRNNLIKPAPGTGQVFGIQLDDETSTCTLGSNIVIENNLFQSGTQLVKMYAAPEVTFRRNTSLANDPAENSMVYGSSGPSPGMSLVDNILYTNEYFLTALVGAGVADTWPALTITGNVLIDNRKNTGSPVPPGQTLTTLAGVGFDAAFRSLNFPGKGCDIDQLLAAIGGETPIPVPSPTPTPTPVIPIPTPTPTPVPSPTPPTTPCSMQVPDLTMPQWSTRLLTVVLQGTTGTFNITAVPATGQLGVSPRSKTITGTSAIVPFTVASKKQSSSITVTGPCGSRVSNVTIQ